MFFPTMEVKARFRSDGEHRCWDGDKGQSGLNIAARINVS